MPRLSLEEEISRSFNSEYEVESNVFEQQLLVLPEKRDSKARDFYEPELFWRRSLPEMSERYGSVGLVDTDAEKLTAFQVKMLQEKVEKLSRKVSDLEAKNQSSTTLKYAQKTNESVSSYKERTMYRHIGKVISYIQQVAHGDPEKILQLVMKVYARIRALYDPKTEDRTFIPSGDLEAWELVKSSLAAFFSQIQSENKGRYSVETRAAYLNVAAALASETPKDKITFLSGKLGISSGTLMKGKENWERWLSTPDEFFHIYTKVRKDKIPEEHTQFAEEMWKLLTRPSEQAKDTIRNPKDRSDKFIGRKTQMERSWTKF